MADQWDGLKDTIADLSKKAAAKGGKVLTPEQEAESQDRGIAEGLKLGAKAVAKEMTARPWEFFDPDQARDDEGQWSESGGGSSGPSDSDVSAHLGDGASKRAKDLFGKVHDKMNDEQKTFLKGMTKMSEKKLRSFYTGMTGDELGPSMPKEKVQAAVVETWLTGLAESMDAGDTYK